MRTTAAKRILASCLALLFLATPAHADTGKKTATPQHSNYFEVTASQWGNDLILQRNNPLKQQHSGPIVMPVDGKLTSHFGPRKLSRRGATRMHKGIDISAPRGSVVVASAAGTVVAVERQRAYGRMVDIDHGDGVITRYAHLDSYTVQQGAEVKAGDPLGTVGRSGRTTGPNLHFEIIINGVQVDPLQASLLGTNFADAAPSPAIATAAAAPAQKKRLPAPSVSQKKTTASAQPGKPASQKKTVASVQPRKTANTQPQGLTVASRGKRIGAVSANTLP